MQSDVDCIDILYYVPLSVVVAAATTQSAECMVPLDVIRDAVPFAMSIVNGHYLRPHRLGELQLNV